MIRLKVVFGDKLEFHFASFLTCPSSGDSSGVTGRSSVAEQEILNLRTRVRFPPAGFILIGTVSASCRGFRTCERGCSEHPLEQQRRASGDEVSTAPARRSLAPAARVVC